MVLTQQFYMVAYCLTVLYLKNLMLYLQPNDEYMAELEISVESDFVLPMRETDEYKPFERKRREMEAWVELWLWTSLSLSATLFECFDMEADPRILIAYLCIVGVVLFRAKVGHMKKFGYNPFDWGKQRYK